MALADDLPVFRDAVVAAAQAGARAAPTLALRPGTVVNVAGSTAIVQLDGDLFGSNIGDDIDANGGTGCQILNNAVAVGQRVLVCFDSPHGAYILGTLGGAGWRNIGGPDAPFNGNWRIWPGASQVPGSPSVPQYRINGNEVRLRGYVDGDAATGAICVLPTAARPLYRYDFPVTMGAANPNGFTGMVRVQADGQVLLIWWQTNANTNPPIGWLSLDSINYQID